MTSERHERGRRSRKSALNVIPGGRLADLRPKPPPYLTKEEGEVWCSIVKRMPPDWFNAENFPLLAAYCQHINHAVEISKRLQRCRIEDDLRVHMALRKLL